LANDIGEGGKIDHGILGIYEGVKLKTGGKIGMNQPLIYTHPFSPHSYHNFYICPSSIQYPKENYS
jgi:hypothetical protein